MKARSEATSPAPLGAHRAAIHAADTVTMHDILSRHFGVIRLADHGQREVFDPIFPAGMQLPPRGTAPVERRVEYAPRHKEAWDERFGEYQRIVSAAE